MNLTEELSGRRRIGQHGTFAQNKFQLFANFFGITLVYPLKSCTESPHDCMLAVFTAFS